MHFSTLLLNCKIRFVIKNEMVVYNNEKEFRKSISAWLLTQIGQIGWLKPAFPTL